MNVCEDQMTSTQHYPPKSFEAETGLLFL